MRRADDGHAEGVGDDSAVYRQDMGAIWTEARRYDTWLEVELAVTDALGRGGRRAGR